MNSYKRKMIAAAVAALCLASTVPVASFAEETELNAAPVGEIDETEAAENDIINEMSDSLDELGISEETADEAEEIEEIETADAVVESVEENENAVVPAIDIIGSEMKKAGYTSEWVKDEQGRFFYYDENGTMLTGEQTVDGEDYLFSKNGVLKTGWRTVKGKRLYFDPKTGKPVYGRIKLCDEEFYIDKKNGKIKDKVFSDDKGDLYLASAKGAIVCKEGFVKNGKNFYYVQSDSKLATGEVEINKHKYLFSDKGVEKVGWVTIGGKTFYYSTKDGKIQLGKIKVDGSIYYIDSTKGKCTGIVEIDGIEHKFDKDTGKLVTGFVEINGNKKYFYEDGSYATGIKKIDGKDYIFDSKANLAVGLKTVNGKLYYSDKNGVLQKGLKTVDKDKYYFGDDYSAQKGIIKDGGASFLFGDDYKMKKGLCEYNGKGYYFDSSSGKMLTGKQTIKDKLYYFNPDTGVMKKGWQKLSEGKYYFGSDGAAFTGIKEIGGKKYYFHEETFLMTTGRRIINGKKYYFDSDGVMATGWKTFDDGKYYFDTNGVMVTGWKTIDSKKYYFDEKTGKMETNLIKDGYNITADGSAVAFSDVQKRGQKIIDSIGTNRDSIYYFVCNNNKYRYIEPTRTLAQINSKGWGYFADYSLSNRYVVCYYFAAVTDLLYHQAGYKTRIVYGTGRGTGDHYWNQVYDASTDTWVNYDTCNGYRAVTFSYLQTQNYTFKQYVYPTYY